MGDEQVQVVAYPLRDVLDRIERKVDVIGLKLDGKADKAELVAVAARLDSKADQAAFAELAERVEQLVTAEASRVSVAAATAKAAERRVDWSRWAIPTLITALYTLVWLYQQLHH